MKKLLSSMICVCGFLCQAQIDSPTQDVESLRKAAEQGGDVNAQSRLGACYYMGQVVAQSGGTWG